MLDGLSELISKQQQLLDETYRAQQQGEYGEQGDEGDSGQRAGPGRRRMVRTASKDSRASGQQGKGGQRQGQGHTARFPVLRQQQGDLQKQLKELMDRLKGLGGKPPEQFDGAGQAMGKAGEALGQENAGARHRGADAGPGQAAPGRQVAGRADDGRHGPARPSGRALRRRMATAIRWAVRCRRKGSTMATRSRCPKRPTFSAPGRSSRNCAAASASAPARPASWTISSG